jgi:ribosomal protein S18 acetylase RimI-like enzyme
MTPATDTDLSYVMAWLKAESLKSHDGFWSKRLVIERAHADGRLLVLREGEKAIAFHTEGEMLGPCSILEVHPQRRNRGFGRAVATHLIQKAKEAEAILLQVQCTSEASRRLMESLNFQGAGGQFRNIGDLAYLPLEKELPLPERGTPVAVTIRFFSPHSVELLSEHHVDGRQSVDGGVGLAKRVIGFSKPTSPDIDAAVWVNDKVVLPQGRGRYLPGFIYKDGAVYVDRVLASESEGG